MEAGTSTVSSKTMTCLAGATGVDLDSSAWKPAIPAVQASASAGRAIMRSDRNDEAGDLGRGDVVVEVAGEIVIGVAGGLVVIAVVIVLVNCVDVMSVV